MSKDSLLEIKRCDDEAGFSLPEILVSIFIISVLSMGVAKSMITALHTAKHTEINYAASSLAISKMEEFAAIDTNSLDSGDSSTEAAVIWPNLNISFTRATAVSVNADNSRTVSVTVSSNNGHVPTSVNFVTTFAVWE